MIVVEAVMPPMLLLKDEYLNSEGVVLTPPTLIRLPDKPNSDVPFVSYRILLKFSLLFVALSETVENFNSVELSLRLTAHSEKFAP